MIGDDQVDFRVRAVGEPAAGMQQVWVTRTGATPGEWTSVDLVQDLDDSTLWTGALTIGAPQDVEFIVQAVNGVGLVSLDDNQGELYRPGQIPPALQSAPAGLDPTSLSLTATSSSGTYSDEVTLTATLTAGAASVGGAPIRFTIGSSEETAFTNNDGSASVVLPVLALPPATLVSAAFDGSPTFAPAAASQPFTVAKRPTTLSPDIDADRRRSTQASPPR